MTQCIRQCYTAVGVNEFTRLQQEETIVSSELAGRRDAQQTWVSSDDLVTLTTPVATRQCFQRSYAVDNEVSAVASGHMSNRMSRGLKWWRWVQAARLYRGVEASRRTSLVVQFGIDGTARLNQALRC